MKRKKEIVIMSHCVLNQNCVIDGWARAEGGFNNIVQRVINQNAGILQLPCPELLYLGSHRPPMTKQEYDTPEHRAFCKEILASVIKEVQEYQEHGYAIKEIIGISGSPSCDICGERGVFMEEFFKILEDKHLATHATITEVSQTYKE